MEGHMRRHITIAVAAATAMSVFALLFWLAGMEVVASTGLQHVGFALPGL